MPSPSHYHPRQRANVDRSINGPARDALRLVWSMTLIGFQLYVWLLGLIIQAPFWILFALCGRHYVVRRNGKTSWVSVWRYW